MSSLRFMEQAIADILSDGLDDWQYLAALEWSVIEAARDEGVDLAPGEDSDPKFEDRVASVLSVIAELFRRGLIVPGGLGPEFLQWRGNADQWLERIERDWRSLGRPASISDVAWFANTSEGNHIAASDDLQ
ncbi:hypothetical protein BH11ACT5_BH11ACT5_17440 [soil metagenome]